MWTKVLKLQASLWVERVPSSENISDPPSRESYKLMERVGARFVAPKLDRIFEEPHTWEALALAIDRRS